MSYSKQIIDYINNVPKKSDLDSEMELVYRKYVHQCDHLNNIQTEIDHLQSEVAFQESELQKVNHEIIDMRDNHFQLCPNNQYHKMDAKYHNLTEMLYPTYNNISYIHIQQEKSIKEITYIIRSMSCICPGDIVFIGSIFITRQEYGFAMITPSGELLFHDDLMTIVFNISNETFHPEPLDFILKRNIKYGNMFQYIVQNKNSPVGQFAYNCCFNNWRTKEEVEVIINYYIDKEIWM